MEAKRSGIVALEEHFWIPELRERYHGLDLETAPSFVERLADLSTLRLREMDEAGIDLQVISHAAPAAQKCQPDLAVELARRANDVLQEAILIHPRRFAGFAALPTPDPMAAADELERTVTRYGFKGAMLHGITHESFIDDKRFWLIFERAAALGVPIYMHPATPPPAVVATYFSDYPEMARAGWGFTMDTASQAIRLIMSGVFDAFPNLKIILGHLGEGIPYSLWRCDRILSRSEKLKRRFRDYFCESFYVTTSSNFSHPALLCCLMEMGADRILFSVDWPFMSNREGRQFIETASISEYDKKKIFCQNAAKLLDLNDARFT
jgi:predicted TIM-barrel fold metal-dependent hydrolase